MENVITKKSKNGKYLYINGYKILRGYNYEIIPGLPNEISLIILEMVCFNTDPFKLRMASIVSKAFQNEIHKFIAQRSLVLSSEDIAAAIQIYKNEFESAIRDRRLPNPSVRLQLPICRQYGKKYQENFSQICQVDGLLDGISTRTRNGERFEKWKVGTRVKQVCISTCKKTVTRAGFVEEYDITHNKRVTKYLTKTTRCTIKTTPSANDVYLEDYYNSKKCIFKHIVIARADGKETLRGTIFDAKKGKLKIYKPCGELRIIDIKNDVAEIYVHGKCKQRRYVDGKLKYVIYYGTDGLLVCVYSKKGICVKVKPVSFGKK